MSQTNYTIFFISFILISFIPLSLVTGPALPDISVVLVCIFFLYHLLKDKQFFIFKNLFVYYSFLFWIVLVLLSFNSIEKYNSLGESLIFLRILLIPIMIYYWLLTKSKFVLFTLFIIFFVNILVIIDSMYQFLNYDPLVGFKEDIFKRNADVFYGRLSGPFLDLVPGSFISKFFIFGFIFLILTIKNKKVFFYFSIIYLTACGIITFISGERMALATFLMAILLGIILLKNYRFIFIISLMLLLLISSSIYLNHDHYQNYKIIESKPSHLGLVIEKYDDKCVDNKNCSKIINVQPQFVEVLKNFSESAYSDTFTLALDMFSSKKITGVGMNNFNYGCLNIEQFKKETCWSHPHNFYLQWLAETGIIGFSFFIMYVFIIFKIILSDNKDSRFKYFSIIAIIVLFWPVMSTGSLLKNWHGIQTFFIIGLSLSILNIKNKIN